MGFPAIDRVMLQALRASKIQHQLLVVDHPFPVSADKKQLTSTEEDALGRTFSMTAPRTIGRNVSTTRARCGAYSALIGQIFQVTPPWASRSTTPSSPVCGSAVSTRR